MTPYIVALAPPPGGTHGIDPWAGLVLGLLLVFLNGFFVAAEFALVKVRPTQLDVQVAHGSRRGALARHMVRNLDAYLTATQLGITLASLALGWVGEPAFAWIVEPAVALVPGTTSVTVHSASLVVAFLVITTLHIVLGELAPKSLAIRKPQGTSLWVSMPLFLFYKLTYPAMWILNHTANAILRLVGIEPIGEHGLGHDEEELRRLLASTAEDHLSTQKRELLDNIFELSHRNARQIMIPRAEVVYLDTEQTLERNLRRARESGHTRFPLCKGDLDAVIGLIHIKDLFRAGRPPESLEDAARELFFVPETLPLDRLLRRMRRTRSHMAAVLDEYGGVSGIVTFENVIEEIVGQVQDEFDMEEPDVVPLSDRVWDVAGGILVADFEQQVGVEFSERDEETIGGVVLSELGRRPRVGDSVEVGPLTAEVLEVTGNRIQRLRVEVRPEPPSLEPPGG